jgi:hypothetical protein
MLKKQKKRGQKKGWSFLLSPTCQGCLDEGRHNHVLGEGRHHHHVLGDDSYNRYKIQTMVTE